MVQTQIHSTWDTECILWMLLLPFFDLCQRKQNDGVYFVDLSIHFLATKELE